MIEHTIYKEFIDKISELSDGIYPIITDLDNDLSYVPDKTADFFQVQMAHAFRIILQRQFVEFLWVESTNMLAIQPGEFLQRKSSARLVDAFDIKSLDEFFHGENLTFVPWVPTKQSHIIDNFFW